MARKSRKDGREEQQDFYFLGIYDGILLTFSIKEFVSNSGLKLNYMFPLHSTSIQDIN